MRSHPPRKSTRSATGALVFAMVSSALGSWQLALVDTDTDELLRAIVKHSSGSLVVVGEDNTIIVSQNDGKTWNEAAVADVSGFGESDNLSIRDIVELPGSHKLLALGVIDQKHPRSSYNPKNGTSTHVADRIEKWTAVLASSDGGKTWQLEDRIDGAALYWPLLFSDGQCILFGYAENIYEYRNGKAVTIAKNTLSSSNGDHRVSIPFAGQVIINEKRKITHYNDYLFSIEERRSIGMSLDRGRTWTLLQTKGQADGINGISVFDEHDLVGVCDEGFMVSSHDAGSTWNRKKIADCDLNAVYASSRCDWWVVGDGGYVAFSRDSGTSWSRLYADCTEELSTIVFNGDCSEGWILGKEGTLIHVLDTRAGHSPLSPRPPEQTVSWSSRTSDDVKGWYKKVDDPGELSQGLRLTVKPGDAKVQVGEHSYSGAQLHISLPPGRYSLTVSKEGYFSREDSIEIGIGSVEEKDIVLRPMKILFSPCGAIMSNGSDAGMLLSLQAGILGNGRNSAGVMLDAGFMVKKNGSIVDVGPYYSHRFDLNRHVFLSPFAAAGGVLIQEISDSMHYDTLFSPAHTDTIKNGTRAQYYDGALQAGVDVQIRRHNNWGFVIRPSLFWTRRLGYQLIMRFGAILWIL